MLARAPFSWRDGWTFVALAGLVVSFTLLGTLGPASLELTVSAALVNLTIVVGLYVFIGNSGVFSFGHLAFTGIGAYTGAILMVPASTKDLLYPEMLTPLQDVHLPIIPATLAGGVVAAVVAGLFAVPLMRLSGLTAALASFAVLIMFNSVASNSVEITNGSAGLSSIPITSGITAPLVWAVVVIAIAYTFQHTRSCLRLRASREDEVAAQSIGVRIGRERTVAFCLSAFIMGLGGALFAQIHGTIMPDSFYLTLTFFAIAMLVLGGIQSLTGAVIGVVAVSSFSEFLRQIEGGLDIGALTIQGPTGLTEVALGLVMIFVLILRPLGITGGRELTWPFAAAETAPPSQEHETEVEASGPSLGDISSATETIDAKDHHS